MNELARLRAARATPIDSRLSTHLDPDTELEGFERRMEVIRQRPSSSDFEKPPTIDLQELVARWHIGRGDITQFTRREIRAVCWDPTMAGDKNFVAAIASNPAFATNARFLRGLWFAHERRWRLSTANEIENLINSYKLLNGSPPRWIRKVWETSGVLSKDAPAALASAAKADWRAARSRLELMAITADGMLGTRAVEAMIAQWTEALARTRVAEEGVELFDAGHEGLLSDRKLPTALFMECVEQFVGAVSRIGEPYRQRIADWIVSDERLGHPARRRTRGNWAGISEKTRQLAVQLFAARDLGAFFQVLIGTRDDPQSRRRFWERYVDSPQLINFAIASDDNDRRKLLASLGKDRADVARLRDAPTDHSAFLMQFRTREYDIVIAEMSKENNSMFIYNTAAFEEHVGELQDFQFTFRELKSKSVSFDQKRHVGEWHGRFAVFLAYYGIYPGKSW